MKCPFRDTVEIELAEALEVDAPPRPLPSRTHVDSADDVDPAGNEELAVRRQAVGRRADADDPLPRLEVRLRIAQPAQRWRSHAAVFLHLRHPIVPRRFLVA